MMKLEDPRSPRNGPQLYPGCLPRYDGDEYVLKDVDKTAHVHPFMGGNLKQGCPLSPLLFS
eukprot:scaffold120500_cov12-Tisochrysis_lutea.AAC.1